MATASAKLSRVLVSLNVNHPDPTCSRAPFSAVEEANSVMLHAPGGQYACTDRSVNGRCRVIRLLPQLIIAPAFGADGGGGMSVPL